MGTHRRAYEDSHPWLTFQVNHRSAPASLWILLGEARSKIEHIQGAPLRPEVAKEMMAIWLAKGALATTAIEGNTLSEEQVRQYLEGELRLPPSQEYLRQEVGNIVEACNRIADGLEESGPAALHPDLIYEYDRM